MTMGAQAGAGQRFGLGTGPGTVAWRSTSGRGMSGEGGGLGAEPGRALKFRQRSGGSLEGRLEKQLRRTLHEFGSCWATEPSDSERESQRKLRTISL